MLGEKKRFDWQGPGNMSKQLPSYRHNLIPIGAVLIEASWLVHVSKWFTFVPPTSNQWKKKFKYRNLYCETTKTAQTLAENVLMYNPFAHRKKQIEKKKKWWFFLGFHGH